MSKEMLIAIGAGAVSGFVFAAPLSGLTFGLVLVSYFTPLPLFLVGLSLGTTSAATAVGAAAVLVTVLVGLTGLVQFLVAFGIPGFMVMRQALLSRTTTNGTVEWYPPGMVLTLLTAFGAAAFAVAMFLLAGSEQGLEGRIQSSLKEGLAQVIPGQPAERHTALAQRWSGLFPAMFVTSWLLMVVINATLAQGILVRSQRNMRPSPRYSLLRLPHGLAVALGVSLALLLLGGAFRFAGQTLAIVFAAPFFLQGLAVVHEVSRGWTARRFALAAFYLVLVLAFSLSTYAAVSALGLIEQWLDLRRRFGRATPNEEDE